MADAVDDTEKLFARANAAIAEATRLAEESLDWRKTVHKGIRLMHLRAKFYPKTLKFYSPLDFSNRLKPGETLSKGVIPGTEEGGQGGPIFDRRADSSD